MRFQTIFPVGVILLFTLLALVACAPAAPANQAAAQSPEGTAVLLVPIEYRDGQWLQDTEGVRVLPCPPPDPLPSGLREAPQIRILGEEGKVAFEQTMLMDPRIILPEDAAFPPYLEEVSFVLRLPYSPEMRTLEFYEQPGPEGDLSEQEPTLTVDLTAAIGAYEERGGAMSEAPCQEPEYKPDALSK